MNTNELEIKLNFKNYKGVKDGEYSLSDSYLYLVKGKNDIGKTSFINAIVSLMKAKDDTPNPIKIGENEAIIIGEIPGLKGMYTIEMRITDKGTSFTMITPENIKVSKVTDIRKVFEYNVMSVQEFIQKSYTPQGRREQIEIILNLLPEESRKKYLANMKKLNDKSDEWIARKQARSALDYQEKYLEGLNIYQNLDIEFLTNEIDSNKELKQKYEDVLTLNPTNKQEKLTSLIEYFKEIKDEAIRQVTEYDNEIAELQKKIEAIKQNKESYRKEKNEKLFSLQTEINTLEEEISKTPKVDIENTKENIANIDIIIKENEEKLRNANEYLKAKESYTNALNVFNKYDKIINDIRTENKNILNNSDLSSMNIAIEDDTLYVGSFVFNENQIADSKLILTTANILLKVLDKSKILVIGKLAELDNMSKSMLYKLAQQNDIAVIGDEVDNNYDSIFVTGFIPEDIGNFGEFMKTLKIQQINKPDIKHNIPEPKTQEVKPNTNHLNFI